MSRSLISKVFDYHHVKSAANGYIARRVGGDQRPVFHDIDEVCPALGELTRNASVIRKELDGVLAGALPQYHDLDPGEAAISASDDSRRWLVYMIHLLGRWPADAREKCPRTCALLEGVPDLMQAFFSVLDAHKSVPAHEGPYLGYLRYHLGLRVPSTNPPHLRVADKRHVWREGEDLLFDDSWTHEVVNEADEPRVVLVVDILRPLPQPARLFNRFMTGIVARHTYGRAVIRRAERLTMTGKAAADP